MEATGNTAPGEFYQSPIELFIKKIISQINSDQILDSAKYFSSKLCRSEWKQIKVPRLLSVVGSRLIFFVKLENVTWKRILPRSFYVLKARTWLPGKSEPLFLRIPRNQIEIHSTVFHWMHIRMDERLFLSFYANEHGHVEFSSECRVSSLIMSDKNKCYCYCLK